MFSRDVLHIDAGQAAGRAESSIRAEVLGELRRRGAVVGLSGGIDSSVVAALCVRALGRRTGARPVHAGARLVGRRAAPGKPARRTTRHRSRGRGPRPRRSTALGCYQRQIEAIRKVVPEYGDGWKLQDRSAVDPRERAPQRLPADRRRARTASERSSAHASGRLPPARRSHQLQAARPQDDGVLPRRPAELRRGRHAQPARVRPGLLRQAGRRRGRLQADRAPLQDAGLPAGRAPRRARGDPQRGRPPPTPTRCRRRQEEFYFALPYAQMDLCLWAYDHARACGRGGAGGRPHAPSRSSASTGTSRPSGAPRATCTRRRCWSSR